MSHVFTTKDVSDILQMKRQGKTNQEIATLIGCGKRSVCHWWRKCGTPKKQARKLTAIREQRFATREWRSRGKSITWIADQLSVPASTLYDRMRRWGLPTAPIGGKGRIHGEEMRRKVSMSLTDRARNKASSLGWPELNTGRQAQVMNALLSGPKTIRELAVLLDKKWEAKHGGAPFLRAILVWLMRLGYVERTMLTKAKTCKRGWCWEYRATAWILARREAVG